MSTLIAAFYRFVPLTDPDGLRPAIRALCESEGVRGTVLLAPEGINGTVAGPASGIHRLFAHLRSIPGLDGLDFQPTQADYLPFEKLKVRLKREIVTLRQQADPLEQVGEYVDPDRWNALLDDPEVMVIDTRNSHEIELGSFPGAVDPGTRSFGEFPDFVDTLDPARPVAMFCTGGIRCEKATSYLLSRGFSKVYHLEGGILRYLRDTSGEDNKWQGECFIFDQRFALDAQLRPRYAGPDEGRAHLRDGWPGTSRD